jgi:hypothetical protein
MISDAKATDWTNFAKRDNPNAGGLPTWPAFSDANPVVLYLSRPLHTGPAPSEDGWKGLDAYFAWRRTPEGEAAVRLEAPASAGRPEPSISSTTMDLAGRVAVKPPSVPLTALKAAAVTMQEFSNVL